MSLRDKAARRAFAGVLTSAGGDRYYCPVKGCNQEMTLNVVKQHVKRTAESEVIRHLHGQVAATPHAVYYEENTKVEVIKKRVWTV